jgi:Right handed beta helix region
MRPLIPFALALVSTLCLAQPKPPTLLPGLPTVGRIDTKPGQVIENLHIVNLDGPCIVVNQKVAKVTIRNNEIGPCGTNKPKGDSGILVLQEAHDVLIQGNVFHDMSNGIHSYGSFHPITVDRNFFYNIVGPYPAGQAVQLQRLSAGPNSGSATSKVTCNVSDADYGSADKHYEDHISMIHVDGLPGLPVEIAYNRIRGGTSKTGSGIMLGDQGGSWLWAHDNVVIHAANAGIGVAGGDHMVVEDNKVDSRGESLASKTHTAIYVRGFNACSDITIRGNRAIARQWNWNETTGKTVDGYGRGPEVCTHVYEENNHFGDASLSPADFDKVPTPCQ